MRIGGRVSAAIVFAAAFNVCACGTLPSALAGDDSDDPTVIIFSGRDIWRNGAFAYGGFITAPGGFEQDGLMFKLLISGGVYRYSSEGLGRHVIGTEALTALMPGWRIKRAGVEIKMFFGLDLEHHRLSPDDPANRLRGNAMGARFAAEFWTEPTPTSMVAGDIALSTIATNQSARLAYGWHVLEQVAGGFYVGPEVQVFMSDGYRHLRLGAHITGMKAGGYEWSAAGGWARDSEGRSSPYVRLGMSVRR